jgi:DNA-binding PadR family transcriptional regulator
MFDTHNFAERCGAWRDEKRFRGRHGPFGDFAGRFERGFGAGRDRLFDNGELRLVILHFIAQKPSYGYELIKDIEERLSGAYAPSPGVVYPTLTMLEEEGYATVSSAEGGKKLYAASERGQEYLKANQVLLKSILARMDQAGRAFGRGRSPQIMRALMNLRFAVKMRAGQGNLTSEQISKIAAAIDQAARAIDEV